MNGEEFQLICRLVHEHSGIQLTPDKRYLVETRLMPVARRRGLSAPAEIARALRGGTEKELLDEVIDAMTTNESFFFRDVGCYKAFRESVLPRLLAARAATKRLRIWSAACSSGQEPYSIAMIFEEERQKLPKWQVDIVATDLSREMIERAHTGTYNHFEAQRGLPIQLLTKYFVKSDKGWTVIPELRARVSFYQRNLLHDFSALGRFDVIFCRNVLIYFDGSTKRNILERLNQRVAPDGALLLGGAETVFGITNKFLPILGQPGLFQPTLGGPAMVEAAV